jgi:Family of unknown function (DUF5989)
MAQNRISDFEQVAEQRAANNIFTDFWYFLRYSRKWWLLPLICVLVLLGGLILLSGTAVAPFIYTLF